MNWTLLQHQPSIENGEATSSLKVKHSAVAERHHDSLEAFHA